MKTTIGMVAVLLLAGCAVSGDKWSDMFKGSFHYYTGASPEEEKVTLEEKRQREIRAQRRAELEAQRKAIEEAYRNRLLGIDPNDQVKDP